MKGEDEDDRDRPEQREIDTNTPATAAATKDLQYRGNDLINGSFLEARDNSQARYCIEHYRDKRQVLMRDSQIRLADIGI